MKFFNPVVKKLITVIMIIWVCLLLAWYLAALAYQPGKPPLSTMFFPTKITATDRATSTPTMQPTVTQATMAPTSTGLIVVTPTSVVFPTVVSASVTPRPTEASGIKSSAVECVLVHGIEPVMFCRVVRKQ